MLDTTQGPPQIPLTSPAFSDSFGNLAPQLMALSWPSLPGRPPEADQMLMANLVPPTTSRHRHNTTPKGIGLTKNSQRGPNDVARKCVGIHSTWGNL